MDNVNIYVLADRGRWYIQLNGKHFGPCPSKETALKIAVSVAEKASDKGWSVEVLVEGYQRFRTVWSARRLKASA